MSPKSEGNRRNIYISNSMFLENEPQIGQRPIERDCITVVFVSKDNLGMFNMFKKKNSMNWKIFKNTKSISKIRILIEQKHENFNDIFIIWSIFKINWNWYKLFNFLVHNNNENLFKLKMNIFLKIKFYFKMKTGF